MYSAEYMEQKVAEFKAAGKPKADAIWETALICVGWPYVFGAWGEICNPSKRGRRVSSSHPKIKENCQVLNGSRQYCDGCKWYPKGKNVLMNDCRGLTGSILEYFGIQISKTGATSQWNGDYWEAKGTIDTIPDDMLVCLFYPNEENPKKMEHTGFGYRGETVECSNGVQHAKKRAKKWTHWAIPKGVYNSQDYRPTLKKGSKGEYVTLLQTLLINRGYRLPKYGADGSFGNETQAAVKQFQKDWGLKEDGIVGAETWKFLESSPEKQKLYTVTIPHVSKEMADDLLKKYVGTATLE